VICERREESGRRERKEENEIVDEEEEGDVDVINEDLSVSFKSKATAKSSPLVI
jgi:hypothetical protein